ncbi:MAG TPA: OmpA family protein [Sulfurovum sp.]|nr:OmpA family protein [Sulfurovum sp.]
MTKKLLTTAVLTMLLMVGCSQKTPDLDGSNISDANHLEGDTVSIDEGGSMGNYNSSSDGFRSIYFAFADYSIGSDMQSNMNRNTQVASSAAYKIKIEGNCDEFGTDEYNYALGLKRAKAVEDSLAAQGIDRSKMMLVSFGESNAVCTEASDSCYQRNRRVDLRLVK